MLKQLLRLPLTTKCGLIAALICAIAGLTLLVTSMTASKQILLETTRLIGQQWTNQLASQSQQSLLRNDRVSLQAILQDYINSPLIVYGSISDARGDAVAEAGIKREENLNYEAGVAADGRLGRVQLSLNREMIGNEIRDLGKTLLLLTIILCALSYALVAVPTRSLEHYLRLAQARLAQPLRDDKTPYPGEDSLGELLQEIHNPHIRLMEVGEKRYRDYYMMHCHWQAYSDCRAQMAPDRFALQRQLAYSRAEAIARLYHGELLIHRHNGISMRFNTLQQCDHPLFRALCAADLMQKLDRGFKCRAGITKVSIEGTMWVCQAAECEAVERLERATAEGADTWLDHNCRNHERLDAWANCRGSQLSSMKPPYDELLQRQYMQLKSLDLDSLQRHSSESTAS